MNQKKSNQKKISKIFNRLYLNKLLNSSYWKINTKKIKKIKEKLRDELRNAVSKENYLSPEDAELINKFINKLRNELSN